MDDAEIVIFFVRFQRWILSLSAKSSYHLGLEMKQPKS